MPNTAPLSREISRRSELPVAGLRFRAMAALFDAGFIFSLAGLCLLTVRLCLHTLPAGPVAYGCYAAGALIIAAGYKLLYCFAGLTTLGQQGARLRIVSFDGHAPTRPQRMIRMTAGWVSLASAGMGILWALVDQETLSWHDHISQTFLTYDE
ncbi:MAG TPA: RDD family protein [Paludibaculum sp.]